jgi:FG-GAP-like repeat
MRIVLTTVPFIMMTTIATAQVCDPMSLFAPEDRIQLVGEPYDIAAADLDHDGDIDLVVACNTTGPRFFEVMLNHGDGTFSDPVQVPLADQAWCIDIADMNGDTHLDAVIGHGSANKLSVVLGDGMGGFGSAVQFSSGGFAAITDLVTVDINEDSHIDVAVVTNGNQIRTMLGDGAGGLAPPQITVFGSTSIAIAAADLNGDLDPDLVVGDMTLGEVRVLYGASGDGFSLQSQVDVGFFVSNIELGDLDNDGDLDVVVSGSLPDTVMVLENNGNGVMSAGPSLNVGIVPDGIAVADFNTDGNNDALVSQVFDDAVALLLGNGDLTLDAQINFMVGVENLELVAADFNGDSAVDAANISNATRSVSVLINTCAAMCTADLTGNGVLDFFDVSAFLAAFAIQDPAADFTNDGNFDFFDVSTFLAAFGAGCP